MADLIARGIALHVDPSWPMCGGVELLSRKHLFACDAMQQDHANCVTLKQSLLQHFD